jgi:hypothetical protein
MGKHNRSAEKRLAQHKRRGKRSQFDHRERLTRANPNRQKTTEAKVPLCGRLASTANSIAGVLDVRQTIRFQIKLAGMMVASEGCRQPHIPLTRLDEPRLPLLFVNVDDSWAIQRISIRRNPSHQNNPNASFLVVWVTNLVTPISLILSFDQLDCELF